MTSTADSASAKARARRLKTLFDLTPEEWDQILEYQGGSCGMCPRRPGVEVQRLSVDHNHKTGEVRGLLCWICNTRLGKFQDDDDHLERAAEYVKDPPARHALGRRVIGRKGRVTNKVRKKTKRKG